MYEDIFSAFAGCSDPVVARGSSSSPPVGLDHGHIYGMADGLLRAGATLKWVYDPDPQKVRAFCRPSTRRPRPPPPRRRSFPTGRRA